MTAASGEGRRPAAVPGGASGSDAAADGAQGQGKKVRVCDFVQRDGVAIDSPEDGISMEDTLIAGELLNQELRHGLFLHGGNVIEEHAFTATSHLREGLSAVFFLDGEVEVMIGDRRFDFRGQRQGQVEAAAIMNAAPESFRRASAGRQHVHHLVVSAAPEWLEAEGGAEVEAAGLNARLFREHLADHRWTPRPRVCQLIREILSPSAFRPDLRRLYLEGRAVEIVAETMSAVLHADRGRNDGGLLTRQDRLRLQRATEMIAADPGRPLTVEEIAREAGVSTSGLQRLFRLSEGRSVFEHVRLARLECAHAALREGGTSVQEASAIAGYASPANFATAFKRQYGITPREAAGARAARPR